MTRFIHCIQFQIDFDVDLDKIFDGLSFTESVGFFTCLHQLKQNLDAATYCNFMKELQKNSKPSSKKSDENSNTVIIKDPITVKESQNESKQLESILFLNYRGILLRALKSVIIQCNSISKQF